MKYALMAATALTLIGCGGMAMKDSQLGTNYTVPNAMDPANTSRSQEAREANCQSYPAACLSETRRMRAQP